MIARPHRFRRIRRPGNCQAKTGLYANYELYRPKFKGQHLFFTPWHKSVTLPLASTSILSFSGCRHGIMRRLLEVYWTTLSVAGFVYATAKFDCLTGHYAGFGALLRQSTS